METDITHEDEQSMSNNASNEESAIMKKAKICVKADKCTTIRRGLSRALSDRRVRP